MAETGARLLSLLFFLSLGHIVTSDDPFAVYSEEFSDLLGKERKLEELAKSSDPLEFHEGPVYFPDDKEGFLLYTTQPVGNYSDPTTEPLNSIRRFDIASGEVTTFKSSADANMPNGQFRDKDGLLLTCEQGFGAASPGRITRTNLTNGNIETVVDAYYGMSLNSPNDVVVKSDGSVWFTDPSYGFLQSFRPKPRVGDFVYRFDASAAGQLVLTAAADHFNKPNGLAFSPDERFLYVTDSGAIQGPGSWHPALPHHIIRYDVVDGRHLRNRQLFAVVENAPGAGENPGIPDGIKLDQCGNVFVGAGDGVQVFNPAGDLIGKILTPTFVSNLEFGGQRGNDLYLMANSNLYRVTLNAFGVGYPSVQRCTSKWTDFSEGVLSVQGLALAIVALMFLFLAKERRNGNNKPNH